MNPYLYLFFYILAVNLMSFTIMYIDKRRAVTGNSRNRISEKTLFSYALFLGAIGIYCGMYIFRHKTKHMKFVILIPVVFIINCLSVYYIISHAFPYFNF
ncbi:hypothetical protein D3C71_1905790 [compost metagenome]